MFVYGTYEMDENTFFGQSLFAFRRTFTTQVGERHTQAHNTRMNQTPAHKTTHASTHLPFYPPHNYVVTVVRMLPRKE